MPKPACGASALHPPQQSCASPCCGSRISPSACTLFLYRTRTRAALRSPPRSPSLCRSWAGRSARRRGPWAARRAAAAGCSRPGGRPGSGQGGAVGHKQGCGLPASLLGSWQGDELGASGSQLMWWPLRCSALPRLPPPLYRTHPLPPQRCSASHGGHLCLRAGQPGSPGSELGGQHRWGRGSCLPQQLLASCWAGLPPPVPLLCLAAGLHAALCLLLLSEPQPFALWPTAVQPTGC